VRHFERVHQQHPIDRGILQRQVELVDQRRQARPLRRPLHHALRRRHEGEAALRLLPEQSEIGRRVADAEHAHATGIIEPDTDAAADESPRNHAEALGVEIAQVDDVNGHARNLSRHGEVRGIPILPNFRFRSPGPTLTACGLWNDKGFPCQRKRVFSCA
jgi:hypothetical protein